MPWRRPTPISTAPLVAGRLLELNGRTERHRGCMKRIRIVVLLTAVIVAVPASARAQEAVTVEATIGLQGYVAPYEATSLTVRVTADVLFVGDMRVSIGGVNLFTAIEVPAGSSKEYFLAIPPTGNNSRAVIQLFAEGSEDHLVRETVAVLNQAGEVGRSSGSALLPHRREGIAGRGRPGHPVGDG